MRTKKFLLLIILLPLFSISQNNYSVVYEADKNGDSVSGDINVLIECIKNGKPIRVGWIIELKGFDNKIQTIEHWADTGFLTILNNQVFAQIKSIYEQGVNFEKETVSLIDGKPNGWVSIISTTGIMNQKFGDILKGTEGMTKEEIQNMIKSMETEKVRTKWATFN